MAPRSLLLVLGTAVLRSTLAQENASAETASSSGDADSGDAAVTPPPPPPPPPPPVLQGYGAVDVGTLINPPTKDLCWNVTKYQLTANNVAWRLGGWQYSGQGDESMWPDGGVKCARKCDSNAKCMHWVFDCKNLVCHYFGNGGYEEDGDGQFGRDYQFLGDSSNNARRLSGAGGKKDL
eukprot:TRINITY_DN3592_c0_g2_i1.p1 TRINITY_DN3592_c0_g2~~TRINITY_DN3592_c0_g2_i1.p1  ORF type:complete len:179 (+),score=47.49 TRINITY_DN3592_c0_g2_i1:111-647(+)